LKVKAVVFDLGKVLVDFDYGIAAQKLADQSTATAAEIRWLIDQSPLLLRYESAAISTEEFYGEVRGRIGFRGTFADFAAAFADIFTEIPGMTRLAAEVRARGLPTFVLSNTNEIAITHVRRSFPFFAHFTGYVFSFEHGVLKPEPGIYEVTEKQARCGGAEILFLDDKQENVTAGARLGWRTIHHSSAIETTRLVREAIN